MQNQNTIKSLMLILRLLGTALFLCSFIGLASPAIASDVLTPEDVALLKSVGSIAISPDGQHVAYTLSVPRNPFEEENGSAWTELHVVDVEGNSRPFVTGEVKVGSVAWTPCGKNITYLAERGEDTIKALYMIPLSGGESQKILEHPIDIKSYSWAPDGYRLAYLAKEPRPDEIEKLRDKGFEQDVYEEDIRNVRVWIYDTRTPSVKPTALDIAGTATELHWSPAGDLLAMALSPTPLIDDYYMERKVSLINPETGELVYKANNPGKLGNFAWSPDGKHLAFITGADKNDPSAGELAVISSNGGDIRSLIKDYDGHIRRIAWKDNDYILFLSEQRTQASIGSINKDGSDIKTLIPAGRPVFTNMCLSKNSEVLALLCSNFDHPNEVFISKLDGKELTRLTITNPWLAGKRFARQEVITYKAPDGLELDGILIHPLDEVAGQRYPLIMQVHGGPEAHRRDNWLTYYSSPGQVAAARGFAVFYPNYRGSTGRGVEFSKMGQGHYAEGEFDDLVHAKTHLVNIGLVDENKVGITGGSYGGYASAWGATALSEHFAASVMGFGVSDLISKFGTTDIPNEMYLVHARSWPWERWQWMLEQSPIYHVDKAKTPILILHGDADTRVHPSQSMELYRYIKTMGKAPVRLVFYPDEPHGNREAAARYDYSLRQLRWMEHYLKGPGGDPPPYEITYDALENYEK